jgi:drug/metabolite transporter (DMT)-like permease
MERGWDPIVLSFYRGALTWAFAVLWLLRSSDRRGLGSAALWGWSALAGFGVAAAFACYFVAMQSGGVAIAATLLYCAPIYVFLGAFLCRVERLTTGKLLGLALVVLGVALLSGLFSTTYSAVTANTIGIGLLSGLAYALFIVGFRKAAAHGSTQAIMAAAFTVESFLLLGLARENIWPGAVSPGDAFYIVTLGLLGGGLSFLLYISGARLTQAGQIALLGMAEPITAAAFGIVLLSQPLTLPQVMGVVLIITTVTALNRSSS